ncbi:hypothetical protein V2J09_005423 [Rumex salicifolius]
MADTNRQVAISRVMLCPDSVDLRDFLISICFCLFILFESSLAATQEIGLISPGFRASQAEWTDKNGIFLQSNNSAFGFGFYTEVDSSLYLLVILHLSSQKVIWSANRHTKVSSLDQFVFGTNGNAYLGNSTGIIWSTGTVGVRAKAMKLEDSGNLVLTGENEKVFWQSFDHPTDTLISGQKISQGVRLESFPKKNMKSYFEIKLGDAILYTEYDNGPQVYWSMSKEVRKTVMEVGGKKVSSATIEGSSWNFYDDQTGVLVWQFNISKEYDPSALWIAVLGSDGSIQFLNLEGKASFAQSVKIPQNSCNIPISCGPFEVCLSADQCKCPPSLSSTPFCKPSVMPLCKFPDVTYQLQLVDERLDYSVMKYIPPKMKTSLNGCKQACVSNCSCNALFFDNSTNNCFLFDQVGALERAEMNATGYTLIIKVASPGFRRHKSSSKGSFVTIVTVSIIFVALVVILALVGVGLWYYKRKKRLTEAFNDVNEEDSFFEGISGLPVRYKYNDLRTATKNFSVRLGQGGFGTVYLGVQADGTKVAVKQLEGVGQGRKEFRAEVNIIGSVHHVHLVKLKGFCTEGTHRLLSDVYSYGMLLLEIIGGRKNYEPGMNSEKSYLPSYAFKMTEEGNLNEIIDPRLKFDDCGDLEKVYTAIKVALWCIQEDLSIRPAMTKVVQMLQGLCAVHNPPISHQMASRIYSGLLKPSSGDSSCSLWTVDNSRDTTLSAIRLSGPSSAKSLYCCFKYSSAHKLMCLYKDTIKLQGKEKDKYVFKQDWWEVVILGTKNLSLSVREALQPRQLGDDPVTRNPDGVTKQVAWQVAFE